CTTERRSQNGFISYDTAEGNPMSSCGLSLHVCAAFILRAMCKAAGAMHGLSEAAVLSTALPVRSPTTIRSLLVEAHIQAIALQPDLCGTAGSRQPTVPELCQRGFESHSLSAVL